jgi:hypothetical protein
MPTILRYLGDLSAPPLTHIFIQLRNNSLDSKPNWQVFIFNGNTPLVHTAHLHGITLSNCIFPHAAIVELEVDASKILFDFIHPKVFTSVLNLRVLNICRSFFWDNGDKDYPVSFPMLEQLTWGCISIKLMFEFFATPNLQYLCLTLSCLDLDFNMEDNLQDFADAITNCYCVPALPNLTKICYNINANYTAHCIFASLPRVSVVHFLLQFNQKNLELYNNFFKALADNSS